MRIYISADLEGVNGVVHSSQTQPGEPGYERAIALMHQELAAVIAGAKSAGATEIYLADAHWDARNLRAESLPEGVHLISGWQRPFSMMAGVSGNISGQSLGDTLFDGVFLTGYHARAGVARAVLSHTYRAQVFTDVKLNGKAVGEIGLNAALAGFYGIPIAFVSGDDSACAEALELLGAVSTVAVKTAISRYSAVFNPFQESLSSLRHGAVEAMNKRDYWNLYVPPKFSTLELAFVDPAMADAAELLPNVKRIDDRRVSLSDEDYSVLFRLFLALGALGASRRDQHF